MTLKEFAVRSGLQEKTVMNLTLQRDRVDPETACALENATPLKAVEWLAIQCTYDVQAAMRRCSEAVESDAAWASRFPTAEMQRLGWINDTASVPEIVKELYAFFGVSSSKGWADYYLNQLLRVDFRISLASVENSHAVSAWLRMGHILATERPVSTIYTPKALRWVINEIINLLYDTRNPVRTDTISRLLAQAGVKFIVTTPLRSTPITGCTRFINDIPCIQIALEHDNLTPDHPAWITIFKGMGHILIHGKKDVFLENVLYDDFDAKKEREARDFALSYLSILRN